jgi:hypothetical protein
MSGRAGESSPDSGKGATTAHHLSSTAPSVALGPQTHKMTYQVILRHLGKFRDGALAILNMVDPQRPGESKGMALAATAAGLASEQLSQSESPESKSSLQSRIEQHMTTLDRALAEIRDLNPDLKQAAELSAEVRRQILINERTIHDIVGAELHFWSAAIENVPDDNFDPTERSWVARMIRLANILGVDDEHKSHLEFLEDWALREHS